MNLNQVILPATDLDISVSFYSRLGLQLIVDSRLRYVRFACPDGNSSFSLQHVGGIAITDSSSPWIYFECEDLDSRVAALREQGVVFDSLPEDMPWLWREARLRDPDGNNLILYFAGDCRLNPPWRLTS